MLLTLKSKGQTRVEMRDQITNGRKINRVGLDYATNTTLRCCLGLVWILVSSLLEAGKDSEITEILRWGPHILGKILRRKRCLHGLSR